MARRAKRATHLAHDVNWSARVPLLWRSLTIGPLWIDVYRDKETQAERWVGYDEEERPCFCRHTFQLDVGALGGHAGYMEDLMAWRMRDDRWLIHRVIHSHADQRKSYAFYSFAEEMPK